MKLTLRDLFWLALVVGTGLAFAVCAGLVGLTILLNLAPTD